MHMSWGGCWFISHKMSHDGVGRPRSHLWQPRGVAWRHQSAGLREPSSQISPLTPSPAPRHNRGNPLASLSSGKPRLCGAEVPPWAVVQSAGRAPSGAVGSSGCGEAALCDRPCLSWCVLRDRTHLPPRSLTHRKPGWGAGKGGGAMLGAPPYACGHQPRSTKAAAVVPTAPGEISRRGS